jgi:glucosamine-6-phosphate deaminase
MTLQAPEPVTTFTIDSLRAAVYRSNEELNAALEARGEANLILATGNSQLTFLHNLAALDGINWSKIRVFHMDEYIGIAADHPASFPRFLREHILDAVKPGEFYPVPNQPDNVDEACRSYEALLRQYPADLVALGIGENGHLAFNDPPYALFDDPVWVKPVRLDEASRRQQVGEGHFPNLDAVPTHAITLTIPALLAPKRILAIVPEARKAAAVAACMLEPIDEARPGSILRRMPHAHLYLDRESAARLPQVQ